jgi:hypothetical protein
METLSRRRACRAIADGRMPIRRAATCRVAQGARLRRRANERSCRQQTRMGSPGHRRAEDGQHGQYRQHDDEDRAALSAHGDGPPLG